MNELARLRVGALIGAAAIVGGIGGSYRGFGVATRCGDRLAGGYQGGRCRGRGTAKQQAYGNRYDGTRERNKARRQAIKRARAS